jgi:drug/metabolite transporter (DMT)-like permease
MEPRDLHRRRDVGGLVFGAILLVVGIYYLLRQSLGFNLPDLNWDQLWPVFLMALGAVVLYGAWSRRSDA